MATYFLSQPQSGVEGTRTLSRLLAKQVHSQLCYDPIVVLL